MHLSNLDPNRQADARIDCDSDEYLHVYYYAGMAALFVYPIGLPVLYATLLFAYHSDLNPDPDLVAREAEVQQRAGVCERVRGPARLLASTRGTK